MKHLFIPYELAFMAKEKGFTDIPFAYWYVHGNMKSAPILEICLNNMGDEDSSPWMTFEYEFTQGSKCFIIAPLYQQIIDWLFEKHDIKILYDPENRELMNTEIKKWLGYIKL